MRVRITLILIAAVGLLLVAPSTAAAQAEEGEEGYTGVLDEQELEGLLTAVDEAYRAYETYSAVIQDHGRVAPFSLIVRAEARQIDALLYLFQRYEIPLPENRWMGNAPRFDSIGDACADAARGEADSAELYRALVETTDRDAIISVYERIQSSSELRHEAAFSRCAEREAIPQT